jgi:hypothetical protein
MSRVDLRRRSAVAVFSSRTPDNDASARRVPVVCLEETVEQYEGKGVGVDRG